jgi:hypothetical protein
MDKIQTGSLGIAVVGQQQFYCFEYNGNNLVVKGGV